ncbi:MAG: ParB/RepB/Spo0J family partition protein [Solirubrobacteraceae bacterium]
MGRGLAAILSVSEGEHDGAELRELHVDLVAPNPEQPRKRFDDEALQALADSVKERGVLQPVLVRPRPGGTYELVAGERRWRAARLAGLETLPALVQQRDDAQSLEDALIENMAREDLNPIEAARAVAGLVEELGLTREEVGRRVGRSRVAVSNLLRLLDLPDEALALVEDGSLTEGHGRALLLADDHADRRSIARAAVHGGWSVRVVEQRAREANAPARVAKRGRAAVHPDQEAAAARISEALGAALGTEVRVRPRGTGYKVELAFEDVDEALALARRLRPRAVA